MIQCMGSECWGFNLLHINGPMYGVWVLGIQPFTYEWSNVWGLSAGDSTVYIWMVQCMGSECWRFNRLHMNGPMYGVWVLGDSTFYIWMVQCMGSEHWGFKLLHINDPMNMVWVREPYTLDHSYVEDWIPCTQTPYIGPLICRRLNPQHSDPIHWTINM
jgi:hypothetical protein